MGGEEERERKRKALHSLYDIWRSGSHLPTGQGLKSKYSARATHGHQNQEFSLEIRAESLGGCGFQAFGSSKSFVFTQRGREPSYSGLFSI